MRLGQNLLVLVKKKRVSVYSFCFNAYSFFDKGGRGMRGLLERGAYENLPPPDGGLIGERERGGGGY